MVKVSGLIRLLLVALVLLVCRNNLVGAQEVMTVEVGGAEPEISGDVVTTAAFGGLRSKCKPYYPWLPADTCGWDFASTAYWWVIWDGTTVCNDAFGRSLAASARSVMGRERRLRTFGVRTGNVLCARDSAKKRVTYAITITGQAATMRSLRNPALRSVMRSVVSRSNVMTVRGAAKGKLLNGPTLYCVG